MAGKLPNNGASRKEFSAEPVPTQNAPVQTPSDRNRYFTFEVASGFCGIAWNEMSITCFRLPAESRKGAETIIQRRLPNASPGLPTAGPLCGRNDELGCL
jgi:hypothetical protein